MQGQEVVAVRCTELSLFAELAQLVERWLPKPKVASPSLVFRSQKSSSAGLFSVKSTSACELPLQQNGSGTLNSHSVDAQDSAILLIPLPGSVRLQLISRIRSNRCNRTGPRGCSMLVPPAAFVRLIMAIVPFLGPLAAINPVFRVQRPIRWTSSHGQLNYNLNTGFCIWSVLDLIQNLHDKRSG